MMEAEASEFAVKNPEEKKDEVIDLKPPNVEKISMEYEGSYVDKAASLSPNLAKALYSNKVFCWIESGETAEVIRFFKTFPKLINEMHSPNNWNPLMYAVRYGNRELIDFFYSKDMKICGRSTFNNVNVFHAAIYSGDVQILKEILQRTDLLANTTNCETVPLLCALKHNNTKMVDLLISRGAYYVFKDVYHNLEKVGIEESGKYQSIITKKQLTRTQVVEDKNINKTTDKFQIKEHLRWNRLYQVMYLTHQARALPVNRVAHSKFRHMAEILNNDANLKLLLKACVGKGQSILSTDEDSLPRSGA